MGDLGNVTAGKDGVANVSIEDRVISLSGDHSVIGRTMVVSFHSKNMCRISSNMDIYIPFHYFMMVRLVSKESHKLLRVQNRKKFLLDMIVKS